MLSVRYLTHKLRSQSLNEEQNFPAKSDTDRDSGTESDDEQKPDQSTTLGNTMEQEMLDLSSGGVTASRRSSTSGAPAVRERARSESGKENSGFSRPVTRQNRRSERGLRERSESASSADGAAPGVALVVDDERVESPVEFCVTDSALPSDSDHGPWGDQHSSEEELECINGPIHQQQHHVHQHQQHHLSASANSAFRFGPGAFGPPGSDSAKEQRIHRRGRTPQQGPEKRKWAQISPRRVMTPGVVGSSERTRVKTRPRSAIFSSTATFDSWDECRSSSSAALDCGNSASSDDEVQALIAGSAQDSPLPLEFRTSPPEGAHRPTRSMSPPPKLFLADQQQSATHHLTSSSTCEPQVALTVANGNAGSPRKRHRHGQRAHNIQRPCLDFEKMQQTKNRSVSTWRHGGELSLFCW